MTKIIQPLPIFDSREYIEKQNDFSHLGADYNLEDIQKAKSSDKQQLLTQMTKVNWRGR